MTGVTATLDVVDFVTRLIERHLYPRIVEVTPKASLVRGLGLQRIDLIEIALELEDSFDIEVPDEVIADATVGSLAEAIAQRIERRAA